MRAYGATRLWCETLSFGVRSVSSPGASKELGGAAGRAPSGAGAGGGANRQPSLRPGSPNRRAAGARLHRPDRTPRASQRVSCLISAAAAAGLGLTITPKPGARRRYGDLDLDTGPATHPPVVGTK